MEKRDFRIVFMGTPEFAVHILERLINDGYSIAGVVTATDKPAGRGQQLSESAVKKCAVKHGLKILQPENLKSVDFQDALKALNADLFVVVAFRMLPESVWGMPPKGTINLHASLLPDYRGAAPINWSIIHGNKKTGVTTFFIEKEIDTGKVIEKAEVEIGENETVGELHDRLMMLGADLMSSTVKKIMNNQAEGIEQGALLSGKERHAPKIFKQDCQINWTLPVQQVHDFIRGLSPYPAAWCILQHRERDERRTFKIFIAERTDLKIKDSNTLFEDKKGILFPCGDHYLLVKELQPEGKRRMNYREFLAGNAISEWKIA